MNDKRPTGRRPAAFAIPEEPAAIPARSAPRPPSRHTDGIILTPDADDPFAATTVDLKALPPVEEVRPRRRRVTLGRIVATAFGILLSLALGLWIDSLIRDLFSRSDWLGYLAAGAAAIGALALLAVVLRELFGLRRLAVVQDIKQEVIEAVAGPSPAPARKVVARLTHLLAARPQTARGRERLRETEGDIIDAPHLLDLAERELLVPLDREARALILASAKRVSIVTAVSPRALVDLAYVLYECSRLIRAMAELYGGRPGSLGLLRLMRDVIAHLAVTGSIAVGDSLVQQVLGHGLASKLSARLGEGVINGLMTARIGIAAMDLCRPMPFRALKRPGIGDFLSDLAPGAPIGRDKETV
ncbi:MAG TPA: TIGR01620 family protein [Mycoplana sp.]|nr:TIGR01620 family protein [Mycoplana sp.]